MVTQRTNPNPVLGGGDADEGPGDAGESGGPSETDTSQTAAVVASGVIRGGSYVGQRWERPRFDTHWSGWISVALVDDSGNMARRDLPERFL